MFLTSRASSRKAFCSSIFMQRLTQSWGIDNYLDVVFSCPLLAGDF